MKKFKRLSILLAAFVLVMSLAPTMVQCLRVSTLELDDNTVGMSEDEENAYFRMMKQKSFLREGRSWKETKYYRWRGGYYTGGYGCAAFAMMMSDVAFGNAKCTIHKNFNKLKVGDVVIYKNGEHTFVVMKVVGPKLVIAEGNYNGKVHWGRVVTLNEVKRTGVEVLTRYD